MTARSPPARPHIGIHPTSHFSSLDWGEDDAWDSASDSESPKQSTLSLAGSRTTAPRAVPKPAYNKSDSSSSTLAFSYTHVNAPNSSSYPPRTEEPAAPKTGWTIVRKSPSDKAIEKYNSSSQDDSYDNITSPEGQGDTDGESDMILGELEYDPFGPEAPNPPPGKATVDKGSIREDTEAILNGMPCLIATSFFCTHLRLHSHSKILFMAYAIVHGRIGPRHLPEYQRKDL